ISHLVHIVTTPLAPIVYMSMSYINMQAQSTATTTPPHHDSCDNTTGGSFPSHFTNAPFRIDDYLGPDDTTCPPNPLQGFARPNGWLKGSGAPGGCTRDIVHRFYEEQFQLNGGQQNRYVVQSDAGGL